MEDKETKIETVSISDAANNDTENNKNATQPENTTADTAAAPGAENNSADDFNAATINQLTAQVNELNDKYLRAVAELENTRRRAALDAQSRAARAAMGIAEKILPVMDAVQAALKHAPDDAGIKSMAMALESAFEQIGITKIESVGQILNPQLHNAIQAIDAPTNAEQRPAPNTIIEEMQTGYMYGDNVLRTAMVVVCK